MYGRTLVLAAALAAAGWTSATVAGAPGPVPGAIWQQTAPTNCLNNPFGSRILLAADQEPVVSLRTSTGATTALQHAGTDPALLLERQLGLDATFGGNLQVATTALDANGDGQQEVAYAAARSGSPAGRLMVTLVRRNTASGVIEQSSIWEWTGDPSSLLDLSVSAANLDPDTPGEELVVAARWNSNVIRVFVLTGNAAGGIAQASNTALASQTFVLTANDSDDVLRLGTGDVLLEGRDQIVLLTRVANPSRWRYRVLRYAAVPAPALTASTFDWARSGGDNLARLALHIGDLGGSAAEELVIQEQPIAPGGAPGTTLLNLHYFRTTRDSMNAITGVTLDRSATNGTIGTSERIAAVAIGELDRRPPQELVAAWMPLPGADPSRQMFVRAWRMTTDPGGFPTGIVAPLIPPANTQFAIQTRLQYANDDVSNLDLAIGDANGDGIGDVFVVGNDGGTVKLRRVSMLAPAGNANGLPDTTTFAQRGERLFPGTQPSTTSISIDAADFDRDSVIALPGTAPLACQRVTEPLLRTVVALPPYWRQLQGASGGLEAMVGRSESNSGSNETRISRFTSHDVSGYVGVQVGGQVAGIGVEASAKVTAGYNFQSERGELRTSTVTTSVTNQAAIGVGRGLVVAEQAVYDCYDYDVFQNGAVAANSDLRACERISNLGGVIAGDIDNWNTIQAQTPNGRVPGQWVSLEPEWANVALFRPVSSQLATPADPSAYVDGRFDTAGNTFNLPQTWVQIDLGAVRNITNIRIYRSAGTRFRPDRQIGVFVSEAPMTAFGLPEGPGITRIDPDPSTGNGIDRWSIWTRGPAPGFTPLRGRYVRVQGISGTSGQSDYNLALSEIQVYTDDHLEPPRYPASVCDDNTTDELFFARVLDDVTSPTDPALRNIHMRGRLEWIGTTENDPGCIAVPAQVRRIPVWTDTIIGGTATLSWSLYQGTNTGIGASGSISHSQRVGAEFDVAGGAVVQAVAGGAYEFSTGVTVENSSTLSWETGLNLGGSVPGFPNTSNPGCNYKTYPFAYRAAESSSVGYEHRFLMVDYVVREGQPWSRVGPLFPPQDCFPPRPDLILQNGFEP